jgi:putative sterol carrier protein
VDLKQDGSIIKGKFVSKKPDVIIHISDGDFVDFFKGRLNGTTELALKKKIIHY